MVKRKIIPLLALSVTSATLGLIITLATFALLGLQAKHLPGGALGAGMMAGIQFPWRGRVPQWVCGLLGAAAGIVGWAIGVLFI